MSTVQFMEVPINMLYSYQDSLRNLAFKPGQSFLSKGFLTCKERYKKWKLENRARIKKQNKKTPRKLSNHPKLTLQSYEGPLPYQILYLVSLKWQACGICCAPRSALLQHYTDLALTYMTSWFPETQQKPDLTASGVCDGGGKRSQPK